ncbi:hypothetical protein [Anatilimnocola aggregata]|uniref:hypothetical protein n=1 Tax=Anatilimnocola aggregata TaxID=2528021 RepID=UPI0011AAF6C2|nr:hypothetical protein [Anatilimnocola aggregata]
MLTALLRSIGVTEMPGCNCGARADRMDRWGVEGCWGNIETIYSWMEESQAAFGWLEKARAAAAAFSTGLAFGLDPARPLTSLVDLAIE